MLTLSRQQNQFGIRVLAGLAIVLLGGTALVYAGDGDEMDAPGPVVRDAHRVLPVIQEVNDLYANARTTHRELEAELSTATDARTALEIQRAIEQLKRNTEIEMFKIQLRHARHRDDSGSVAILEKALEHLTANDPESPNEDGPAGNQSN